MVKTRRSAVKDEREPVELSAGKATRSVIEFLIQEATKHDFAKVALGSFVEGAKLDGEWSLSVDVARVRLIPQPDPSSR